MNQNIFIKIALFLSATSLLSCGGNDTQTAKDILEGTWTGTLAFVEARPDTCSATPVSRAESHKVAVNDPAVLLEDNSGLRHDGTLVSDNQFDARFATASAFVDYAKTISYRNVANGRAEVTVTTTDRAFEQSCTRKWAGTMVR